MNLKNTFLVTGILMAIFAPVASVHAKSDIKPQSWIDKVKENQQTIALGNAQVTATAGATLTVAKDGKTYTVLTDSDTKFKFRFWGKDATIADIKVGHKINVLGNWTTNAKTEIKARSIRDLSIQKRFAVFIGKVLNVLPDGFTMNTVSESKGDQTVTISSDTKLTNRKQKSILKSDIKTDDRVMVKGLWDSELNTVTQVTHVKDFNLPLK